MKLAEILAHPDFVLGETKITTQDWVFVDNWVVPLYIGKEVIVCRDDNESSFSLYLTDKREFEFANTAPATKTLTVYSRWVLGTAEATVMITSGKYLNRQDLIRATADFYMVGPIIEETVEVEVRE